MLKIVHIVLANYVVPKAKPQLTIVGAQEYKDIRSGDWIEDQ